MAGSLTETGARGSGETARERAAHTAKALLHLIHLRQWQAGDRLPPQEQLRRTLGIGNARINAAMALLVHNGILARQTKTGTVVRQPHARLPDFWTVALPTFVPHEPGAHSFFVHLHHSLQTRLLQARCRIRVYVQPCDPDGMPRSLVFYEELLADAERGALDAVISPVVIEPRSEVRARLGAIPAVHIAGSETEPCAVHIDRLELARRAVHLLAAHGARRLVLVLCGQPQAASGRCWEGFRQGLAEVGRATAQASPLCAGRGLPGGVEAGRALLALPPSRRPDGLVIMDDWIAHGLTSVLRQAGGYRPALVVQTNRQVPLGFGLPVIRCEVDIEELARRAVDLALAGLTGRRDVPAVQYVEAVPAPGAARELPWAGGQAA